MSLLFLEILLCHAVRNSVLVFRKCSKNPNSLKNKNKQRFWYNVLESCVPLLRHHLSIWLSTFHNCYWGLMNHAPLSLTSSHVSTPQYQCLHDRADAFHLSARVCAKCIFNNVSAQWRLTPILCLFILIMFAPCFPLLPRSTEILPRQLHPVFSQ